MNLNKEVNFARPNKIMVTIPELPILSSVVQSIDLETVTIGEANIPSGMPHDFKAQGEKLTYGGLDFTFLIDENYDVYAEIYNFMNQSVGPNSTVETRTENTTDILISILDNSSSNIVRQFNFVDCWVNLIGNLSWDFSDSPPASVSNVMFSYQYFTIAPWDSDTTGFTKHVYNTENYPPDVF